MPLSPKRERFAQHYAMTNNGAQAAMMAGYSPGCAKVTASRLLTDANVQNAVRSQRCEIEAKLEVTKQRVLEEFQSAIQNARSQGDAGAMIAGWREIARLCGYYEKDRETKISINITAKRVIEKMETMTDAELLALLNPSSPQPTN